MATLPADFAMGWPQASSATRVAACLVAAAVAHAPALGAAFQFDDYAVIVDNPAVHSLTAWWASMPGIRPLLKLAYALNYAAWPGAAGFHAVNVALHLVNTLLAWRLSEHWLPRLGIRSTTAAPAAALLFALHPATTEAVAYASGRSMSLAAMFMLAAWLADARFRPTGRRASILSPLLFAAALGVRETSLVAPLALALLAACAPTGENRRQVLQRFGGHAVVVVAALAVFIALPGYRRFFAVSLDTRGLAEQAAAQWQAHAYLIGQPLLALHTNIDPPLQAAAASPASLVAIAALLAGLATAILLLRRRSPWLAFAIGWYFLMLAPSNSLLPRLDLANDRHLYLALLGPAWLLAGMLAGLRRPRLECGLVAILALVLGVATWQRSLDYRSETALWTASIAAAPANARAWTNLGYAWRRQGDLERARDAYLCALAFDRRSQQAILNLDALGAAASPSPRSPRPCDGSGFADP